HAGLVAESVTGYLASVEQRAQEARIAAAEERGKALAARRAQRLTVALAVSVLLTMTICGLGYLWLKHERTNREAEIRTRIEQHLAKTTELYGRAQAAGDLSLWTQLTSSMEGLLAMAVSGDCDPVLRARVGDLARHAEQAHTASLVSAEREARERRL